MTNYLLMDLRRLLRTRGFYVAMLLSLVLLAIFAGASYLVTGISEEMLPPEHAGDLPLNPDAMLRQARRMMNFSYFLSFYLSSNSVMHLLITLMAAGFISKDHQTGYLKNLLCIRGMREKWLVSKLLVTGLGAIMIYAAYAAASALAVLLYGNPLQVAWGEAAGYLGLHLTVDLALFAVICLCVAIWQSRTVAVVVAMLLSFNLQAILYLLIDQFRLFSFNLREWGMMGQASRLRLSGSLTSFILEGEGTRAADLLPVSLGIALAATLACLMVLRTRDYKG